MCLSSENPLIYEILIYLGIVWVEKQRIIKEMPKFTRPTPMGKIWICEIWITLVHSLRKASNLQEDLDPVSQQNLKPKAIAEKILSYTNWHKK